MQPTNYHKQRTPISAKSHALKIQPSFVSRFIRNSTGAIIETYHIYHQIDTHGSTTHAIKHNGLD